MNNNSGNNFLIGTIDEGITNNTKPWATPKDSFEMLTNAYQWRGRIVKKSPYSLLGQLTFVVTGQTVAASQNFTINLFSTQNPPLTGVFIVPRFMTITVNGGAVYTLREDPNNPGSIIQVSGTGIAFLNGSINYITGALALNFSSNPGGNVVITFSYAYGLPVMGLRTRELFELNEQDSIAFDTKFAYRYSNTSGAYIPLPSVMPVVWSGTDSQFFFTTNYAGAFWATNSKPGQHGWAITDFTNQNGLMGNLATVQVTSPGNNVQVGDYVYFLNLSAAVAGNAGVLAIVTIAGNPFTVQATNLLPRSRKPNSNTFVWTDGATSTGFVYDSMQSLTGQDGIRYYGALTNGTGWANYNPPVDLVNALLGALLIFPYRGYLVFLNTTEGNEQAGQIFNYGNRARWTQIGTPYYSFPVPSTPNPQGVDIEAVRDDLFGKGGANDAPTQEVIIGACFIRDILIVFFERSCWRLRFVNNAQNPFVWERINVELGASSTFSVIPFDKGGMAIGERGIVIADANDVQRIDEKIPDTIFDIRIENQGMQRVYGIRTFRTRLNYWTYPSSENDKGIFPDQVLVYNYETKTWAKFDDCFTCFGYFYAFDDMTWNDLDGSWSKWSKVEWGGGNVEKGYENVIAGNQQGFVFNIEEPRLNSQGDPNDQNGPSLIISAITNGAPNVPATFTSANNNLPDGSWVVLSGIAGTTSADGVSLNGRSFKVVNPGGPAANPNNFTLQEFDPYNAGLASGLFFIFQLSDPYIPIFPGSVNIQVGALNYVDSAGDGVLYVGGVAGGTINYTSGTISLNFPTSISPTAVIIRVVSQNPAQGMPNVETIGTYTGGGYISKTSNFDIQTKYFNFLQGDKRARLSKIDFYVLKTQKGEFTCNIFADSSNQIVNSPLNDNPRQNIVKTTLNPYQFGDGDETIYRLYCDAAGQTLQAQFFLTDQQMGVPALANSPLEIIAMNWTLRPGGRLV